jgi:hypothetical protein
MILNKLTPSNSVDEELKFLKPKHARESSPLKSPQNFAEHMDSDVILKKLQMIREKVNTDKKKKDDSKYV